MSASCLEIPADHERRLGGCATRPERRSKQVGSVGELTGIRLAQQTEFKQAHISNFLTRKRVLSIEGMDKVLNVQHLSVLDLLEPTEVNKRASILPPTDDEFDNVLLVDGPIAATEPLVMSMNVREILKFKKSFLRGLRPETEGRRDDWERFVVIQMDGREGMSMYPRLLPGATALPSYALLGSPAELERGEIHEFVLCHAVDVGSPSELFVTRLSEVAA